MKKIIMFLLCLAAVVGLQAQETIPYTQGFESSSLPTGWAHVGSGTAACAASNPHTGSKSLKFSGATADNVVKLPTFTEEIANLEIVFWTRPEGTSSSGNFDIGYLTDATDASSFVAVETYNCATEGTTYKEKIVTFAGAPTGAVMALRHRSGSTAWYWFVDDVDVHTVPTCLPVFNIATANLAARQTDLVWSSTSSAEYLGTITPAIDGVSEWSAYDTTYTFTDLTPETQYAVTITSVCTPGDTSRTVSYSFTTPPSCLPVSDFVVIAKTTTSATIGWTAGGEETEWVGTINPAIDDVSEWNATDTNISFEDLTPETNYTLTVRAVCGPDDTSAVRTYYFFTGYCAPNPTSVDGDGITNVQFGVGDSVVNNSNRPTYSPYYGNYTNLVGQVPAGTDAAVSITYNTGYTYGTIIWVDWNNNMTFDGNEVVYVGESDNNEPTTLTATFHVSDTMPLGNYRMRIAGADSYFDSYTSSISAAANANPCFSYSYSTVHDYTLQVSEAPSCMPVSNLQVHNVVSTDSIYATWESPESTTAWELYLTTNSADVPDIETTDVITSSDTSYLFDPLSADSTYYLYVRGNCGGDVSSWSIAVSFHPGLYIMAATGSDTITACGLTITDNGGLNGSYGNNCNSTLVLYPSSPDSSVAISGTYIGEGCCDYLKIYDGVGTAGTQFCNISSPSSGTEVIVGPFISTTGPLTIVFTSDGSGAYDGYELQTSCLFRPACDQPTNFVSTYSNGDTVSLAWNGTSASSYQVVYGTMGFDPDNAEDSISINDTACTLTGLPMGQSLDFYVRADCGSEQSWWAGPVRAMTSFFYNMHSGSDILTNACGYIIADNGGPSGSYSSSFDGTLVLLPENANQTLVVSGTSYTEGSYDYLTIYDGVGTSGTVLFCDNTSGVSSTIPFGPFTSDEGAITISFHSDGSTQYDGFAMAVQCVAMSSCIRPNQVVVDNVDNESVTLSWNERGEATSWVIEYGPTGFTPGTEAGTIITASTNPFTITGLTSNTPYDAYIASDCGTEQSAPSAVSFRTACDAIDSLPYFYGFEDANGTSATSQINPCWKRLSAYSDGYPYPSSTARTGNRSMYFYSYQNASCLVLPLFDEPLANLQLKFALKRASSYSYSDYNFGMKVGVMTDPNDMNSFTEITTVQATSNSVWDTFTVYMANYTGEGQYIAFMDAVNSTEYYSYIYLDDITVDFAPECGPVSDLSAIGGITTALVSWTPSAVGEYNGATVEYKTADDEDWTSVQASDRFIALTGLDTNANYTVRVINNCTDGLGMPVTTTFSTSNFGCIYDPATLVDATIGTGNTTNEYIPSYSFYNNALSQQIYFADEIEADSGALISQFSFELGSMPTNRTWWIYLTNTNASNLSTDFIAIPGSDQIWQGYTSTLTPNAWNTITLSTPFVYTGGNIMVTFRDNTGSYNSGNQGIVSPSAHTDAARYAYDDNLAFNPTTSTWSSPSSSHTTSDRLNVRFFGGTCASISTCGAPIVMVNGVTPYTADLVWAPGNEETSWIVEYKKTSDDNWTLAGTATAPSYTLTNLSQGTNYMARITNPACTDSLNTVVRFVTECAMISSLPFTETFNTWPVSSVPNCWSRAGSYSTYGTISSSYNHSGVTGKSIYTYSSGSSYTSYTTLPEIDTTEYGIDDLQVVFYAYNPSTSYSVNYAIGVMVDQNNPSTFRAIDTVSVTEVGNWQVFEVPLSNYNLAGDTGAFISIKSCYLGTYGYGYIDDITVEQIPTCPRPDSLMAANATSSSVDLSWHERGGANEWVVEYGPVGFQLGTGTIVTANSNPFTLTGIPSAYDGEFYVRSICSLTDSGEYSRMGCRFSTSQIPATLPYVYDFEDASEWANWQTNSNNNVNFYRGTAAAADGQYSMYVSADSGATVSTINGIANVAAWRDIDFGSVDSSYTLTFKTKLGGSTAGRHDALMVFLVDPSTPVVASNNSITSPWGNVNDLYRIALDYSDTNWHTVTASFDTIHGIHRVAFFWFNQSLTSFVGEPAAIDSITIDYSSCPRPVALDTVSVSAHAATIDWQGDANANYLFVYREYPNGRTLDTLYTNTNSITLTGLPVATTYICAAQKLCGGADSSLLSDAITFTTKCDVINASEIYTEDFEGYTEASYSEEGDVPNCWVVYSNGTSTAYTPHVTNYSSYCYPNSGVGALTLTSGSSTYGDTKIAALPVFAEPLNTLTMKFYYRMESTSYGTLTVGYVTDDSDLPGSFVAVKTISTTTDITQDSVTFDSITAAGRIAFKWVHNDSYYSCGIDDIEVTSSTVVPVCHAPEIVSLTNDYQSATLTWSGDGSNYEVAIRPATEAAYPTPTTVTTTSYTFNGLTPATTYYVQVRQDCTADTLGYSDWVERSFVTDSLPCFTPTNVSYNNVTFNTAEIAWSTTGEETAWEIHVFNTTFDHFYEVSTNPATADGLTAGTSYSAAVRALCGSEHNIFGEWSDTIQFTTDICDPVTNVHATANGLSISLTWTAGENNCGNFEVEYGEHGFGQGEGTTVTVNGTSKTFNGLYEETTYDFYVRAVCAEGLTSAWSAVASATTGQATGDECYAPTDVNATANGNSITFTWTAATGNTAEFEVEYGQAGFAHGQGTTAQAGPEGFTANNLEANTTYDFYVRAICQTGNYSDWSDKASATTGNIGIYDVEGSFNCNIFPNPATDETTISVSGVNGQVTIAVVDMNGRTISSETLDCSADCVKKMNVSGLTQGAYFVRIYGENVNSVKKLIVR